MSKRTIMKNGEIVVPTSEFGFCGCDVVPLMADYDYSEPSEGGGAFAWA